MGKLAGKAAIVTGAARGLGQVFAQKLTKEGARVIVADILEAEAKETASELCKTGGQALEFVADLRETGNIVKLVEFAIEKFGRIDILVNNAGVNKMMSAIEITEELFDWIVDIDMRTPFFLAVETAKRMMDQGGGKIVNISSAMSKMYCKSRAPYSMAKAGVNAMTGVLAAEWAPHNIRVNAIAPGWIKTAIPATSIKRGVLSEKQLLSVSPVNRWGTEEEIADLVVYLSSDDSSYIVGQTIFCDGGWSIGMLPEL